MPVSFNDLPRLWVTRKLGPSKACAAVAPRQTTTRGWTADSSPTNITSAFGGPSPKTVCVPVRNRSQALQPVAAWRRRSTDRSGSGGKKGVASQGRSSSSDVIGRRRSSFRVPDAAAAVERSSSADRCAPFELTKDVSFSTSTAARNEGDLPTAALHSKGRRNSIFSERTSAEARPRQPPGDTLHCGQPFGGRDQPLSAAARAQPGGLVPVGAR